MKKIVLFFILIMSLYVNAQQINIYVALCEAPYLPDGLGDGNNLNSNLYWGAGYGIKTYFSHDFDWLLVSDVLHPSVKVSERIIYKHKASNVHITVSAYPGEYISEAITDCLRDESADLVVYIGHNALIGGVRPDVVSDNKKDIIILSCYGQQYFEYYLRKANCYPVLWTTTTISPEAYILDSALNDWINRTDNTILRNNVVNVYAKYQRCGFNVANKIFITGW